PVLAFDHLVEGQADAPPPLRLPHGPAQRPGHQLVAETDADQWTLVLPQGAHETAQRINPGQPIIDTEPAAGDQPGITLVVTVRQLAIQHPVDRQLTRRQLRPQLLGEHLWIVAVQRLQAAHYVVTLQNPDSHISPR